MLGPLGDARGYNVDGAKKPHSWLLPVGVMLTGAGRVLSDASGKTAANLPSFEARAGIETPRSHPGTTGWEFLRVQAGAELPHALGS